MKLSEKINYVIGELKHIMKDVKKMERKIGFKEINNCRIKIGDLVWNRGSWYCVVQKIEPASLENPKGDKYLIFGFWESSKENAIKAFKSGKSIMFNDTHLTQLAENTLICLDKNYKDKE